MADHEFTPSKTAVGTLPPSLRGTPSSPLATIDSGAEIRIRGAIGQGGRGVEIGSAEFPIAKISHDVMFDTAFRDPVLMVRPHSARPIVADERSAEEATTPPPQTGRRVTSGAGVATPSIQRGLTYGGRGERSGPRSNPEAELSNRAHAPTSTAKEPKEHGYPTLALSRRGSRSDRPRTDEDLRACDGKKDPKRQGRTTPPCRPQQSRRLRPGAAERAGKRLVRTESTSRPSGHDRPNVR
jgi:hypothetical protein